MNTFLFISCLWVIMPMPATKASERVHQGCPLPNQTLLDAIDVGALLAFEKGITSDPSEALLNWDCHRNHFCNWTGVRCNTQKWRVIGLDLRNMSLQGTISSHLGNMSFLQYLDLSLNRLEGHIPPALGRLRRLNVLFLNRNLLQGPIPSALGGCLSLTELHLSKNNLNGSIPHQIGQLRRLRVLSSWGSDLTGIIPDALGNCSMLQLIDLSENNLSGRIPFQLGFLTRLQRLQLDQNHLTGKIPPHLLNCTGLRNLSMIYNRLSGPVPSDIGASLPSLQCLVLSVNELSGSIPKSLGNCSRLSLLELANNELTGIIPAELGSLINLEVFDLNSNGFVNGGTATTPPILDALSNCSKLRRLDLSFNRLTGTLPKIVGQLSPNLTYLSLEGNRFEGKIPEEMGNLTALIELYLSSNSLVGSIPSTIGSLLNLQVISLNANKLGGTIPSQFGLMQSLEYVYLSENMLSGEIPKSLGRLGELRQIDLSVNRLSGTIPPEIGNWISVELLDVSQNALSGSIPLELATLRNLQLYLNLSNNMLTGSVPAELGGMQMVQVIDLSANRLSGSIPNGISSCVELQYLNLSHNQLGGKIPSSIFLELRSLQNIDLSSNRISGPIPSSMTKLAMQAHVNLSYNNLAGPVPCEGALQNASITSFLGNPQLCGNCSGIASCFHSPKTQDHKASVRKEIVLIVSIISIFAMCCFGLGFWICFRTSRGIPSKSNSLRLGKSEISREELSRATEDYNPRNLIGAGSYGTVYKGVLAGGETVAIKVFTNLNVEQAHECFHRELQTLSSVRHPNLVKIIGWCSAPEFRALVLKFMSNGSLDMHLHRQRHDQVRELSLKMRLSILCDIAHGISYLHHICCPSMVHCDLKPQNVLLDENMRAGVADFGIARLSNGNEEAPTTTSTFKGSIGYVPPEYGLGGRVWTRGDVYSYGIVVLEMISGKRPTDEMFGGHGLTLPRWVSVAFPGRLQDVVESSLLGTANQYLGYIKVLAQLGLWCTCEIPENRPSMQIIEKILENQLHQFTSEQ